VLATLPCLLHLTKPPGPAPSLPSAPPAYTTYLAEVMPEVGAQWVAHVCQLHAVLRKQPRPLFVAARRRRVCKGEAVLAADGVAVGGAMCRVEARLHHHHIGPLTHDKLSHGALVATMDDSKQVDGCALAARRLQQHIRLAVCL